MPRRVTYAIGDIHGRIDLAAAAVDAVRRHAGGDEAKLVFLGDYVDRGPDSRSVVELMLSMQQDPSVVCLKGNHEALMIRALERPRSRDMDLWKRLGGEATLQSYGASDSPDPAAAIPPAHLAWMIRLPLTSGDGERIYVHAGLRPWSPFDRQSEEDCLWIREKFLEAPDQAFDRHVVHGHTPVWRGKPEPSAPELLAHRTNLDTGAFATGVLAVGVFPEDVPGGPAEVLLIRKAPAADAHIESIDPQRVAAPSRRRGPFRLFRS